MKKLVIVLSGIIASQLSILDAAAEQSDFKFSLVDQSTLPEAVTSSNKSVSGTDLALARPDMSPGDFDMAATQRNPWERSDSSWLIKQPQNDFQIGSTFTFGSQDDAEKGIMISPRYSKSRSNDSGLESYTAEIRLGSVLEVNRGKATKGWYIFAAADGEALSIKTNSFAIGDGNPMSVSYSDQITVGDLQAGVSTYVGNTQFTISYIQTEAEYSAQGSQTISKTESFAGFSLAKSF